MNELELEFFKNAVALTFLETLRMQRKAYFDASINKHCAELDIPREAISKEHIAIMENEFSNISRAIRNAITSYVNVK